MDNNFIVIFFGKLTFLSIFRPSEKASVALTAPH